MRRSRGTHGTGGSPSHLTTIMETPTPSLQAALESLSDVGYPSPQAKRTGSPSPHRGRGGHCQGAIMGGWVDQPPSDSGATMFSKPSQGSFIHQGKTGGCNYFAASRYILSLRHRKTNCPAFPEYTGQMQCRAQPPEHLPELVEHLM